MANPPPLNPEIAVIPNIPYTNQFGLLMEEGGSPACVPHDHCGAATKSNAQRDSDPTPDDVQIRWANGNLDLVLQKVDEVKTLVMSLMGLLKETLVPKCACSCRTIIKKAGTDTGPTAMNKLVLQPVVPPSKVAMNPLPLELPLTLAKCNQQHAVRLCKTHTGALNTKGTRGSSYCDTFPPSGSQARGGSYIPRFRRHCLSVIRSDILEVGRHDLPGLNYDYISVSFIKNDTVDQLMELVNRTNELWAKRMVGINLSTKPLSIYTGENGSKSTRALGREPFGDLNSPHSLNAID
ncbi:hypothetical protein NDU88_000562 [Pleurodeles waltl]|uniref:Pyruvate kinase n=1 Tax=Pleurodeles waltl TaxID=8319 RepID=A0AAV7L6Z3_PLEWA|nr:hypothetical protein NDU88_000562 [Pleurodeles waltl]